MSTQPRTTAPAKRDKRSTPHRPHQDTGRLFPPGCRFIDLEEGLAIADEVIHRNRGAFEKLAKL